MASSGSCASDCIERAETIMHFDDEFLKHARKFACHTFIALVLLFNALAEIFRHCSEIKTKVACRIFSVWFVMLEAWPCDEDAFADGSIHCD